MKNTTTPDDFLKRFPARIQALANRMRAAVKKSGLDMEESVSLGWQLIAYKLIKGKRRKYFCFIAPTEERVALGFQQGTALLDASGLLESNEVHIRRIIVRGARDVKVRLFAEYTREAAEIAWMNPARRAARKLENEARREAGLTR